VHELSRLQKIVTHRDARADLLVADRDDLEAVELVEAEGKLAERGLHRARHTTLSRSA
jgi:hypothetical protein